MRMHSEGDKRARILLAVGNVTERKRAEASLFSSLEQLRESEERLRVAMAAGKMGTWDWNILTGEILWSRDHNIMYGIPVEQENGTYTGFFQYIHPDDREKVAIILQKAIETHKDFATEMRSLHANGRITWIAGFGRAFYNDQGKAHRMIGIVIDITERKKLETQKEDFIGIASHELKTPVTSIKSYTQLLLEMLKIKNEAESLEIIEKLDRQVDRLAYLIADLLDITRISEGQMRLHRQRVDINVLVQEIAELMQRTTIKHVIELELPSLPVTNIDRERIGQVLINLLGNAIKYSPNGQRIIVQTELKDNMIRVNITDFGIGMSEETRQKVFERFFRAGDNKVQTFPGLGLGLFIASDIIKKHGGEIGVESEKNKGTLIFFTLPVQAD
jgi:PAS domain S-box-containing protein